MLLGLAVGWATLTRPTDGLIVFIPILWGIGSLAAVKPRVDYLKQHSPYIGVAVAVASLFLLLQMSYWKYATGHWIVFSYQGEGFEFGNPHIIEGLFSFRKGWFLYTPIALLGFLGVPFLRAKKDINWFMLLFSVYFAATFYVVFSWKMWFYGGSFGCRALIQSLPMLALPLTALFQTLYDKSKWLLSGAVAVVLALVVLNIFQTWQYSWGILHWADMTKKLL